MLRIQLAMLFLLTTLLAGCGSGDGQTRYPISGEVLLNGQPLAEGTILFYPVKRDHDADVATITAGKYSLAATAGAKRVEIEATVLSNETEPSALGGAPVRKRVSLIPPRYNRDSDLTAEVTAGGPNQFKFELTDKK